METAALPDDLATCHGMIRELAASLRDAHRQVEQPGHRLDLLLRRLYGPTRVTLVGVGGQIVGPNSNAGPSPGLASKTCGRPFARPQPGFRRFCRWSGNSFYAYLP